MAATDLGFLEKAEALMEKVREGQKDNVDKATDLMVEAIKKDELIHVYGGGGHTTLVMGEMFFRAGGLANIDPIMETGLSVFNQSLKYLELERTVNYGSSIVKYYDIQPGEVLIIFHNIGINPATIDAADEAKKRGAKIIAVSSSFWQNEMPADHVIRHPNKKNLFDYADVCIDDYNPVGDALVSIEGFPKTFGPVSNIVDFYIAHWLEIDTIRKCVEQGINPPVWTSANTPGGDAQNAAYIKKYRSRVKNL